MRILPVWQTWFWTLLKSLKPEHVAFFLALALLVYAETGRSEGEQIAGPAVDACPIGQDRVMISYGPIRFEGCISAAERERSAPKVIVNGKQVEPPLRVLIVRSR